MAVAYDNVETITFSLCDSCWEEEFGLCLLKNTQNEVQDYGILLRTSQLGNTRNSSQSISFGPGCNVILLTATFIRRDITTAQYGRISIDLAQCKVGDMCLDRIPCENHHQCPYKIELFALCLKISSEWHKKLTVLSLDSHIYSRNLQQLVFFCDYPTNKTTVNFDYIEEYPPPPVYRFIPLYFCIEREKKEHVVYGACIHDLATKSFHMASMLSIFKEDNLYLAAFKKYLEEEDYMKAIMSSNDLLQKISCEDIKLLIHQRNCNQHHCRKLQNVLEALNHNMISVQRDCQPPDHSAYGEDGANEPSRESHVPAEFDNSSEVKTCSSDQIQTPQNQHEESLFPDGNMQLMVPVSSSMPPAKHDDNLMNEGVQGVTTQEESQVVPDVIQGDFDHKWNDLNKSF
jgi:hypothetical protein